MARFELTCGPFLTFSGIYLSHKTGICLIPVSAPSRYKCTAMLTVDQLKRFSNQCLKLRQTLQTGLRCSESEYMVIKTHIETLVADLEKQIEEPAPELLNSQTEMSSAS